MVGIIIVAIFIICIHSQEKRSLIWLCLERCGESKEEILKYTEIIKQKSESLTDLSFEKYDLGWNSSLVVNDFTDVYSILKGTKGYLGKEIRMFPMVTSANIEKMRAVFKDPQPFIDALVTEAQKFGYTGYNIDFEPEHDVEESDRPLYNAFLKILSSSLLKNGILINVDVATWGILWNYQEINAINTIETIITMETYVSHLDDFKKYFQEAYAEIDHERLGIGLDSEYDMKEEDLQARFDYIGNYDISYVAVWRYKSGKFEPTSLWWKLMYEYLAK